MFFLFFFRFFLFFLTFSKCEPFENLFYQTCITYITCIKLIVILFPLGTVKTQLERKIIRMLCSGFLLRFGYFIGTGGGRSFNFIGIGDQIGRHEPYRTNGLDADVSVAFYDHFCHRTMAQLKYFVLIFLKIFFK